MIALDTDVKIASIVIAVDATPLSANEQGFERVHGLQLESSLNP